MYITPLVFITYTYTHFVFWMETIQIEKIYKLFRMRFMVNVPQIHLIGIQLFYASERVGQI